MRLINGQPAAPAGCLLTVGDQKHLDYSDLKRATRSSKNWVLGFRQRTRLCNIALISALVFWLPALSSNTPEFGRQECKVLANRILSEGAPRNIINDETIVSLTTNCARGLHVDVPAQHVMIAMTVIEKSAGLSSSRTPPSPRHEPCREARAHKINATALLFPGYGLSRASMLPYAEELANDGIRGILVDLPGQGESSGSEIGYGYLEAEILRQIIDKLRISGIIEGKLLVIGTSYGASVAIDLGAVDSRVDAVVAIAPFSDTAKAIRRYINVYDPVLLRKISEAELQCAIREADLVLGYDLLNNQPINFARMTQQPVLFITGARDELSPADEVKQMFNKVSSGYILLYEHADHFWLVTNAGLLAKRISTWLTAQL